MCIAGNCVKFSFNRNDYRVGALLLIVGVLPHQVRPNVHFRHFPISLHKTCFSMRCSASIISVYCMEKCKGGNGGQKYFQKTEGEFKVLDSCVMPASTYAVELCPNCININYKYVRTTG